MSVFEIAAVCCGMIKPEMLPKVVYPNNEIFPLVHLCSFALHLLCEYSSEERSGWS